MKHSGRCILRNFRLMDMCSDVFRGWKRRMVLVIEEGTISDVCEEKHLPDFARQGDADIDLAGGFLMPGLIDLHVHIANPFMEPTDAMRLVNLRTSLRQIEKNLRNCVESGVTTIRDMGAPPTIQRIRKKVEKGQIVGPRIICSNSMISCPAGYPDMVPEFSRFMTLVFGGQMVVRVRGKKEAVRAVADMVRMNADWIKFVYQDRSYLVGRRKLNVLDDETVHALVKKAHAMNRRVAMHQTSLDGFRKGLLFDVDTIEHVPADEVLTDRDAGDAAIRGIALVPTLKAPGDFMHENLNTITDRIGMNPGGILEEKPERVVLSHVAGYLSGRKTENSIDQAFVQEGFGKFLKSVERLHRAGTKIGFGTDCGGTDICLFGFPYDEMKHLNDAGMNSYEILRTATFVNAEILNREKDLGSISPGKAADLLVLKENSLENLNALRNIAMVMKGGAIVHRNP